jgi:hypothetical protein
VETNAAKAFTCVAAAAIGKELSLGRPRFTMREKGPLAHLLSPADIPDHVHWQHYRASGFSLAIPSSGARINCNTPEYLATLRRSIYAQLRQLDPSLEAPWLLPSGASSVVSSSAAILSANAVAAKRPANAASETASAGSSSKARRLTSSDDGDASEAEDDFLADLRRSGSARAAVPSITPPTQAVLVPTADATETPLASDGLAHVPLAAPAILPPTTAQ